MNVPNLAMRAAAIQSVMIANGYKPRGPHNTYLHTRIAILYHMRLNLLTPKRA